MKPSTISQNMSVSWVTALYVRDIVHLNITSWMYVPSYSVLEWDYINAFRSCDTKVTSGSRFIILYLSCSSQSTLQPHPQPHPQPHRQAAHPQAVHPQAAHPQAARPPPIHLMWDKLLVSLKFVCYACLAGVIHVGPFLWPFTCIHSPIHPSISIFLPLCCPCSCHGVPPDVCW